MFDFKMWPADEAQRAAFDRRGTRRHVQPAALRQPTIIVRARVGADVACWRSASLRCGAMIPSLLDRSRHRAGVYEFTAWRRPERPIRRAGLRPAFGANPPVTGGGWFVSSDQCADRCF